MTTTLLNALAILIACAAAFAIEYRGQGDVQAASRPIVEPAKAAPTVVKIDSHGMVTYRPNLFTTIRYPQSRPFNGLQRTTSAQRFQGPMFRSAATSAADSKRRAFMGTPAQVIDCF